MAHVARRIRGVLEKTVSVWIPVGVHPIQGELEIGTQRYGQAPIAGPVEQLDQAPNEEGCGIDAGIVGGVRHFLEGGELSATQLMEDLSGFLIAPRIDRLTLIASQKPQSARADVGIQ